MFLPVRTTLRPLPIGGIPPRRTHLSRSDVWKTRGVREQSAYHLAAQTVSHHVRGDAWRFLPPSAGSLAIAVQ